MDIMIVLRALLYRLREGGSWRALSIFGKWRTIYGHWRRWVETGIWDRMLKELSSKARAF